MLNPANKNLIIVILLIVCGVLAGGLIYSQFKLSGRGPAALSAQEAAELGINFINENLLPLNIKASLVGVVPSEEESLYKFKVKVGEEEFFSYITKDGKILFPEGITLEEEVVGATGGGEEEVSKSCQDIPKTEKPLLEAFVVSYCPYGTQMQRVLVEILKDIPSLAGNIKISYMGAIQGGKVTAMHGEKEAEENLRQICLREEQKDKFVNYLSCFLREGKTEECSAEVGIDEGKLSQCMTDELRGISYAREDFEAQDNYKVSGSPTLVLNGETASEFNFGGRTAQAVKTLLCCGFEKEVETCSRELSREQAAIGFSETYSSGDSSGGSCE